MAMGPKRMRRLRRSAFHLVLVTGTRGDVLTNRTVRRAVDAALRDELERAKAEKKRLVIMHGDSPRRVGIDEMAQRWGEAYGVIVGGFAAAFKTEGGRAGPARNSFLVSLRPDVVIAFPMGLSTGTRNCLEQAKIEGIDVRVIELPDNKRRS